MNRREALKTTLAGLIAVVLPWKAKPAPVPPIYGQFTCTGCNGNGFSQIAGLNDEQFRCIICGGCGKTDIDPKLLDEAKNRLCRQMVDLWNRGPHE